MSALISTDAEMSTLGACILKGEALVKVRAILKPEHFAVRSHQLIFQAMLTLSDKHVAVDLVTLKHALLVKAKGKQRSPLEECGGVDYLVQVCEFVPSSANAVNYAGAVLERYERRLYVENGQALVRKAMGEDFSLEEVRAAARSLSDETGFGMSPFIQISQVSIADEVEGVRSGFPGLDKMISTRGFPKGQITVVMADTKGRKSWFLCQVAAHMAVWEDIHVAYVTLADLNKRQVKSRMVRQMCGWTKRPEFSPNAQREFDAALSNLDMAYLSVYDASKLESPNDVETIIGHLVALNSSMPLGAVVWDYAQETSTADKRARSDEGEQRIIGTRIAQFAQRFDIPVIVGSQITTDAVGKSKTMYARAWLQKAGWVLELFPDKIRIKLSRFGLQSAEDEEVFLPVRFDGTERMRFYEIVPGELSV